MNPDSIVAATIDEVKILTEKVLEDLLSKWHSMYVITDEIKSQRLNQFLTHLKDFYHEMNVCEEQRKSIYTKEVEKKLKECHNLENALNVVIQCDVDCSSNPLTEVIKHLDNSLKAFEVVKQERMEKLKNLKTTEGALCRLLGSKEIIISNSIPTEDDINRLENNIFVLEEEKFKRLEKFQNHRNNIIEYINKLEVSTLLDYERTLVESDMTPSLTPQDMDKVQEMEERYKDQFSAAKTKVEYKLETLVKLWNRLDIPSDYRENFMDRHGGVGRHTLDSIQSEIHRCERIRRDLVGPLIMKNREKISELCDCLGYTDEQRSKFLYEDSHNSEDVLDILEIELGKLELIYAENRDLLELIQKQRDMWERKIELDEAAKDKARLFNNRGGQLLREEKERKTIEQAFPKLTRKLEDMLIEYEDRNGHPFQFFGDNLLLRIRDEREQNNQKKNTKKNESKITDSASRVREKRRLDIAVTPRSERSKRLKLTGSTTSLASSASKSSNKSATGRTGGRTRLALFKDKDQDTSVASSYSLFQEGIEEKIRSNADRRPLKDVNSGVFSFHSSPSQDSEPRFNLRSKGATSASSKSAQGSRRGARAAPVTPASSKRPFATPRAVPRSAARTQTPLQVSSSRPCTPGMDTFSRTRTFFDTPKSTTRSSQKTFSLIRPAKFNFNI